MNQIPVALTTLPFEPQVPPEQVFEHASWRRVQQAVLEALAAGWLAIVVGESGVGKTLLLRNLERLLRAGGLDVHLSGAGGAAEPIASGGVRLVDGADALDDAALRRLVLARGAAVLTILPGSVSRVRDLPVRVALVQLSPLSPEEVGDFVAAALAGTGRPPDLFGAEAIAALASMSRGLPRHLNALGRASLLRARMEGAPHVEVRHVEAANALPRANAGPNGAGAAGHADAVLLPRTDARRGTAVAARARWASTPALQPAFLIPPALLLALAGWFLIGGTPHAPGEQHTALAASGTPASIAPTEGAAPALIAEAIVPRPQDPAPAASPGAGSLPPIALPRVGREQLNEAAAPPEPRTFRGTTFNETLGRGGGLQISVSRTGPGDAVVVWFKAHGGLVGAGRLAGRLLHDGRLVASGTLMMGQNAFATSLEGTISGDLLVGTARYSRIVEPGARPSSTHGVFRLTRG